MFLLLLLLIVVVIHVLHQPLLPSLYRIAELEENTDSPSLLQAEMAAEDHAFGLNDPVLGRNHPLCPLLNIPLHYLRRARPAPCQLVTSELSPCLTPLAAMKWRNRWREHQRELKQWEERCKKRKEEQEERARQKEQNDRQQEQEQEQDQQQQQPNDDTPLLLLPRNLEPDFDAATTTTTPPLETSAPPLEAPAPPDPPELPPQQGGDQDIIDEPPLFPPIW